MVHISENPILTAGILIISQSQVTQTTFVLAIIPPQLIYRHLANRLSICHNYVNNEKSLLTIEILDFISPM